MWITAVVTILFGYLKNFNKFLIWLFNKNIWVNINNKIMINTFGQQYNCSPVELFSWQGNSKSDFERFGWHDPDSRQFPGNVCLPLRNEHLISGSLKKLHFK